MDVDLRHLLFGTVGRDGDTLAGFVEDLKAHGGRAEQIQAVCSDLSPAFSKGIREHLPKAEITFDRFHLMKLMNEALDAVRREESSWLGYQSEIAKSPKFRWNFRPESAAISISTFIIVAGNCRYPNRREISKKWRFRRAPLNAQR